MRERAFLRPHHVLTRTLGAVSATRLQLLAARRGRSAAQQLDPYSAALTDYEREGLWERAIGVLDEMQERRVRPTASAYSAAVAACGKAEQWAKSLELLQELQEQGVQGVTARVYNAVISACARGASWEPAVQLFQQMQESGPAPDAETYLAVLGACERAGQWEWAVWLLEDMQKHDLPPDVAAYNAVMRACEKGERSDWVLHLMAQMRENSVEPDLDSYAAGLAAAASSEQAEWTEFFLAEMRHRQLEPEEDEDEEEARTPAAPLSPQSLSSFIEQLEGAANLYREAVREGAFQPWLRDHTILDLHGMSLEVAKVAVYDAIELMSREQGSAGVKSAMYRGLRIIVGRGLHSDKGVAVIAPAIEDMLIDDFGIRLRRSGDPSDPRNLGSIRIHAKELKRVVERGGLQALRVQD